MKKNLKRHVLRLCLGCLSLFIWIGMVLPVAAEPTPSIQFLMKEPVSMMDWGLKNIEDHLYRHRSLFIQNEKSLLEP